MKNNLALVLYYKNQNRYSFNALVGAIEENEFFNNLNIYFMTDENELITKLQNIIKTHKKTIVAFSFFSTQIWDTYRIITKLKEKYGDEPVYIAGGPHPTGDPSGTLKMGFDIVVIGEGEETLTELLQKINANHDYKNIKGIAFIDNTGKYHFTGQRPIIDLDKYPPFSIKHSKFGPIEISRGCPFICYFCQTPYIFGAHQRHRSIGNICRYVQIMKEKNLLDIRFITPDAFSYGSSDRKKLNINKLEELLKNIKKIIGQDGKIFIGTFPSEVRPEHVTEETIEIVLKYANNDNLIIGAQSGSQRILNLCHRGHTVEDIYNAVKLTLKAGLKANIDFIFGLPEETEEDIQETINVIKDLVKMGAKIHAHTFIPLPQTPFAQAPAGKIGTSINKLIKELIHKDIIYGNWTNHGKIAKRINRYLRSGSLE